MSEGPEIFISALKDIYEEANSVSTNLRFHIREERLALREAVKRVFPCHVRVVEKNEQTLIWVKLDQKADDWFIEQDKTSPTFIQYPWDHFGGAHPSEGIVYTVWSKDTSLEMMKRMIHENVLDILKWNFVNYIRFEWRKREASLSQCIGLHDWSIYPLPKGPTPCTQIIGLAHLNEKGEFAPYSFENILERVNSVKLLQCVPSNVFDVLNRAVKLCIWGYQEWEFFTVAQHYIVMAIETSFTTMYAHSLAHPVHVVLAPRGKGKARINTITVEMSEARTYGDILAQALSQERREGIPFDIVRVNGEPFRELRHRDQKKSIIHLFRQHDIVASGEAADIDYLLWKRNYFSHPHGTHIDMMTDTFSLLYEVVTLINRTWGRFLYPDRMIWENVWIEPPVWALEKC